MTNVSHDHHVVTLRYPESAHNNRILKDTEGHKMYSIP